MTNVIFPLSKLLDHKKIAWKFLKEWAFFVCLFCSFSPFPQNKNNKKKAFTFLEGWGNLKNNSFCEVSHLSVPVENWEEKNIIFDIGCRFGGKLLHIKSENSEEVKK